MPNKILITGATGNIGSKLTSLLLAKHSDDRVVLLVRGRSDADARDRIRQLVKASPDAARLGKAFDRLEVLAGDITQTRLGLGESAYEALARSLTHVVHSAASTCFTLPLASARLVNVQGTVNVMELARHGQKHGSLTAVAHVSTAYVNGPSRRAILEQTLESRSSFFNTYERTKWEAERYVRSLAGELPLVIFRPSTVVGDSRSGHTNSFNVLYTPLRLISRDRVRCLPGCRHTVLDVVPSDYVARAIRHVLFPRLRRTGCTLHLVAGYGASMTVEAIVTMAMKIFGVHRDARPMRYVAPDRLMAMTPDAGGNDARVNEVLRVFAPFMTNCRNYDDAHAREALQASEISCPPFARYIRTCLEYCVRTDWGRRAPVNPERRGRLEDRRGAQPVFAGGLEPVPATYP